MKATLSHVTWGSFVLVPETPLDWIELYPTYRSIEDARQSGYKPEEIIPVLAKRLDEAVNWQERFASDYQKRAWESRRRGDHEEAYKLEEYMQHHRQSAQIIRRDIQLLETEGLDSYQSAHPPLLKTR